jgi:cysteine desulfurase
MKVDVDRARGSMRFSFGRFNTEAEVDRAVEILPAVISKLRSLSATPAARETAGV